MVPSGVEVAMEGRTDRQGPQGHPEPHVAAPITVTKSDGVLDVTRPDDERESAGRCTA